jgi:hypothetical protein
MKCVLARGFVGLILVAASAMAAAAKEPSWAELETQFRTLPMEGRRHTGPLFWLHGDESRQQLETELKKVAEGGNGCFTAESRPHVDWLGEGWYRDLAICLETAKRLDLKMWIFDEKWWPSQMIGGKVPAQYATKKLVAEGIDVDGPKAYTADGFSGPRYVAAVAGRLADDGGLLGDSLVDLAPQVRDGKLAWDVPTGKWKVMKFTHEQGPGLGQGRAPSVDGASRDCVDWFIKTVYQPHYDHFKADFGKTIKGFFYDEPETRGDWGTEVPRVLAEWGVDWKRAYAAYKFRLSGDDDVAARYQYMEAFADAWGKTMYGSMAEWCRAHGVVSMGHFMEHGYLYINRDFCAGDMMRLQKYSDMGGIDLVCRQMYPGQRPHDIYQTPKLGSSISHVYGKQNDVTMCEMFGAYGQDITYPQMKWLTDQMQVRGVSYMIPHSFNPRAPYDSDCPPYFYNGGYEPRYALYRVYADYTSRLANLLTGGRHVCPVAVLFSGNTRHVGKALTPEDMTTAVQDAVSDCDWLPLEVLASDAAKFDGRELALHGERYRVLVVPAAEVISYPALAKVKAFFEAGGVVLGYGLLPSKSGTVDKTSADVAAITTTLWGDKPACGTKVCRTNAAGGRTYFLPEKPTTEQMLAVMKDASVPPVVEVLQGDTGGWLHVLHRVKAGRDVYFLTNQNHTGDPRRFSLRFPGAKGTPEVWDAMRNQINSVAARAAEGGVELSLTLEPNESVLVVFADEARKLPARELGTPKSFVAVTPDPAFKPVEDPVPPRVPGKPLTLSPVKSEPFAGLAELPAGIDLASSRVMLEFAMKPAGSVEIVRAVYGPKPRSADEKRNVDVTAEVARRVREGLGIAADNTLCGDTDPAYGVVKSLYVEYRVDGEKKTAMAGQSQSFQPAGMAEEAARITVNGRDAVGFIGRPLRLEITPYLKPGRNTIRIEPFAPSSARLAVY